MIHRLLIILIQQLLEDNKWVTNEKMGNMACQKIIYIVISQLLIDVFVINKVKIIVLGLVHGIIANIGVNRIIARLVDDKAIIL